MQRCTISAVRGTSNKTKQGLRYFSVTNNYTRCKNIGRYTPLFKKRNINRFNAYNIRYFSNQIKPKLTYFGLKSNSKGMTSNFINDAGHDFIADEPKSLGGNNLGPNPMDYISAAVTSCSQVLLTIVAGEKKIKIGTVKWDTTVGIDLRGLMGVDGTIVEPQTVDLVAEIELNEKDASKIDELKQEVEKRCPVYNLYNNSGIKINSTYKPIIIGQF